MAQMKASAFGCLVALVLILQLGLHMQLLQKKAGIYDYGNLTDDILDQYSDTALFSPALSSANNKIIPDSDDSELKRTKRFLQRLHNSLESNSQNQGSSAASFSDETYSFSYQNENNISSQLIENSDHSDSGRIISEGGPWEGVSQNLTIGNFYTGNFIVPNTQLCEKKGKNLTLLVLVPSAVSNFQQRQSVRRTWGSFASRKDVAIGFVIGNPRLSSTNVSMLDTFQSEIDLFGDIIIADFKDSYKNLTLKVLYMIEWASTYCSNAKFYMKTDDDVFLNVPLLLNFISMVQENDSKQPKIYGNVFSGHLPNREPTHKHHVSQEVYPHNIHYPNFTSGPAYLISSAVLKPLLNEAIRLPFFNLEDVFLTGFVASTLHIPRINVTQFRNELENPFDMPACKLVNMIAGMTDGSQTQIYYVWYNYLMGTVICKHLRKFR